MIYLCNVIEDLLNFMRYKRFIEYIVTWPSNYFLQCISLKEHPSLLAREIFSIFPSLSTEISIFLQKLKILNKNPVAFSDQPTYRLREKLLSFARLAISPRRLLQRKQLRKVVTEKADNYFDNRWKRG